MRLALQKQDSRRRRTKGGEKPRKVIDKRGLFGRGPNQLYPRTADQKKNDSAHEEDDENFTWGEKID